MHLEASPIYGSEKPGEEPKTIDARTGEELTPEEAKKRQEEWDKGFNERMEKRFKGEDTEGSTTILPPLHTIEGSDPEKGSE
jgi:hypothetical protein